MVQSKMKTLIVTLTEEQAVACASGLVLLHMSCQAAMDDAEAQAMPEQVTSYLKERLGDIRKAQQELQKAAKIALSPTGSELLN